MGVIKRQRADGTWEYVGILGRDVTTRVTDLETQAADNTQEVTSLTQKVADMEILQIMGV